KIFTKKEFNKKTSVTNHNIRCFKCNGLGHYSNKCINKSDMMNNIKSHKSFNRNVDTDNVKIDGRTFNAIFDTGASESVITSKILTKIPSKEIIEKNGEFTLINRSKVKITRAVNLKLKIRDQLEDETFNIIENKNMSEILLCNSLVKKHRKSQSIPIE
ncbi:hypothetical protein DMUE_2613, partial [Dictyocoela muelleri]